MRDSASLPDRPRHHPLRVGVWPSRASSGMRHLGANAEQSDRPIGLDPRDELHHAREHDVTVERLGDLLREGLGDERRVAHLEPEPDDGPTLGCDIVEHLGGQFANRLLDLRRLGRGPAGKVVSRLCPRATHGVSSTTRAPSPRPSWAYHRPIRGPNSATRPAPSGSAAASSATVVMPSPASRREIFVPTPHRSIVGRSPITSSQFSAVSRNTPARLAEPRRDLGAHERVADAHAAVQASAVEHRLLQCPRVRLGVVGLDADERLVPAEHLHGRPGLRAKRRHHLVGCRVVGLVVDRQDHRLGRLAGRDAQRHARADAELASLVRRRRDHGALGRVAPAADDHAACPRARGAAAPRRPR